MRPEQIPETVAPDSEVREAINEVLRREARAVLAVADKDDPALYEAVRLVHQSSGPVVVAGIGKSGHIARKIASTFCSLGKPAVFLHAAEASHGDLGLIQDDSAVIVLSNSGETSELSDLLHYCQIQNIPMIGITARVDSTLAKVSRVNIAYGSVVEACVNGLAPTTSTTVSLAIGDALAVGVSKLARVAPEDFRRFHPGGKLGARLKKVAEIMRSGDEIPRVSPGDAMSDVFVEMSQKPLGLAVVMDGDAVKGVISDGDIRRAADRLWKCRAVDVASAEPIWISKDARLGDAVVMMQKKSITVCLVGSHEEGLVGVVHLHDVLATQE